MRQDFEPTARKLLWANDGSLRTATWGETHYHGQGLVRFGVTTDAPFLLTWNEWEQLCERKDHVRALKKVAREQGADVRNFRVSLESVFREHWVSVEAFLGGAWVEVSSEPAAYEGGAQALKDWDDV